MSTTKAQAKKAARSAGQVYVEVEFSPGHTAFVRVVKKDLWDAIEDFPNEGRMSAIVDGNGDVWIGPSVDERTQDVERQFNRSAVQAALEQQLNRIAALESMIIPSSTRAPALMEADRQRDQHGRTPPEAARSKRGPVNGD